MANAEGRNPCSFLWEIGNPFFPGTDLEATFYYGPPPHHSWGVIFESVRRGGVNYWDIEITLVSNVNHETSRSAIVLWDVNVTITDGTNEIARKTFDYIVFHRANRYQRRFLETVVMRETRLLHRICILVEFDLIPRERCLPRNTHYSFIDLFQLSQCMKDLRDAEGSKDLKLKSAGNERSFNVHSYIIKCRWTNFFRVHRDMGEAETNISENILSDIITYMYCGNFPRSVDFLRDPEYSTELCQVIDRFELEHLYNVFVQNDHRQYRLTINQMNMHSVTFDLPIVARQTRIDTCRFEDVHFCGNPRETLLFKLQIRSVAGNWLSYTVHSMCSCSVHVEVILEMVRRRTVEAPEEIFPFDGRTIQLHPFETIGTRPLLFLGCLETFGGSPPAEDETYELRCLVNVSIGTGVQHVRSVNTDEHQNPQESWDVLGDHMRDIYEGDAREMKARMLVSSRPTSRNNPQFSKNIHKEILQVRAKHAWKKIAGATSDRMPNPATFLLKPIPLECVLKYMYSGKVQDIPNARQRRRIRKFALKTGLCHLNFIMVGMDGQYRFDL